MSTKFSMQRDINGYNGFGVLPTTDIQAAYLTASAAQSITVPDNYPVWIAIFSYSPGSSIWVSFDGDDAVLPGASFASSNSCLNPSARTVKAGSTISLITSDTFEPGVSIEFQIVPPYQN